MTKLMVQILKLWNGNQSLAVAFWGIYFPIMALHLFVVPKEITSALIFFAKFLHMLAWGFSLVALWRCAPNVNYKNLPFRTLAKILVVINLLPLFLIIIVAASAFFT
jgi:hypothetical protein